MLSVRDPRLYFTYDDNSHVQFLFKLGIGDKIWDSTDPYNKNKCLELEKMLQQAGFATRIAQEEDECWAVTII